MEVIFYSQFAKSFSFYHKVIWIFLNVFPVSTEMTFLLYFVSKVNHFKNFCNEQTLHSQDKQDLVRCVILLHIARFSLPIFYWYYIHAQEWPVFSHNAVFWYCYEGCISHVIWMWEHSLYFNSLKEFLTRAKLSFCLLEIICHQIGTGIFSVGYDYVFIPLY